MSIKFQLVKARGWSSTLIAWFGGAAQGFSHGDVIVPDGCTWATPGSLLGSRSDIIGGQPAGVYPRPKGYAETTWQRRVVFELPATPTQESLFWQSARSDIGKHYNELAIIGFVIGQDWTDSSSEFCVQFLALKLEAAGLCEKLYFPESQITPDCFAFLLSALGAVVVEHEENGVLIPC